MIRKIELEPRNGAAVQNGEIRLRLPVLRWACLALIFSLLWFREYGSPDGPRSPLYFDASGGFRWVDFLVLGLIYAHVLWILATRQPLPKIPRILKKPALLFVGALGTSLIYGLYQEASHVYFDWRDIFMGVGLALVFSCWIRTPAALLEAAHIFASVMGVLVLYIWLGYATGARKVLSVIPGLATPLYDGSTLSAAVLLALLAFRLAPQETSRYQKLWWMIIGSAAFLLVLTSFRRTFWAELATGALVLAALQKKRRLAAFGFIVIIVVSFGSLGGERVYRRAESMNPFAVGQSEYTMTNEDHVNDVLDALDHVKEHPILGIGLGRPYRTLRITGWKAESWGVHNGLVHAWLFYGLAGLVAYLWFHASLFRWLKSVQDMHSDVRVQAFAQVGLAYLMGPFLVSFAFSPWPYGGLNTDILIFFIIGSLLFSQTKIHRSKRGPAIVSKMVNRA
jgi:hypothetical protein